MEMYGAQKANKTMETTTATMAARDNGPWRWHCVYALWCPRSFVHSFLFFAIISYFCSDAAASASAVVVAIVFCTAGHARKGRSLCCAKGAKKLLRNCFDSCMNICKLLPRGSAWRRALQDNSRQFTCTLEGSFWASESESVRGGRVTQPCLIMLIYANNQCKASDNECERDRESEREACLRRR